MNHVHEEQEGETKWRLSEAMYALTAWPTMASWSPVYPLWRSLPRSFAVGTRFLTVLPRDELRNCCSRAAYDAEAWMS